MKEASTAKKVTALVLCLACCYAAAAVGAPFTARATSGWYRTEVDKPSWTPPDWAFGPVWTLLYTMMAVAAWLVWQRGGFRENSAALGWFIAQLVLNAAWTPIFFGARLFGVAAVEIVLLWAAILVTMVFFFRRRPAAGWLMLPYLLWVTYASTLNIGFWWLNR